MELMNLIEEEAQRKVGPTPKEDITRKLEWIVSTSLKLNTKV